MYTYFILIILLSLILYFNIKIYNFDLLSPSFLYTTAMILSSTLAFIGLFLWNDVSYLSIKTILICILSVVSFNAGEYIIRKICNNQKKSKKKKIEYIDADISWWKIIIQFVFVTVVFCLIYSEVYRIATVVGYKGEGISTMIKYYRNTSILFSTKYIKAGININIIVSQLQKIVEVICFVNIYLIVAVIFNKDTIKNRKVSLYALIVAVSILSSLLTGGRMRLVVYAVFTAAIILFKLNQKYSYVDMIKKYKKEIVIIIIVMVTSFYCALPLLGRKTDTNIIEYTTFYYGAPIPSLEKIINEDDKPAFFGEETFRGIQNVAYKLKISDYIQPISIKWVYFYTKDKDKLSSNIYTSAKRYYHDFGYLGVILLQLINGLVLSLLYVIMKQKKTTVSIIFYSMYVYMAIDQVRDEHFFSNFVHINTIFKLVVLVCLMWLIKLNLKGDKDENKNRKLN